MEIRVHPILIEFYSMWLVLCENARDLVYKGLTWDIYGPAFVEAAKIMVAPDIVDSFIRLSELAFRKYEKELMS
jgi:hypothetical protein